MYYLIPNYPVVSPYVFCIGEMRIRCEDKVCWDCWKTGDGGEQFGS